ncbi:hypothetical protein BGW38_007941 [Lunasporangiospora selenospora]|uniref:AAA+ ATPase domain-containing protein n=1 Tax=Lunasporangiospora selenospora TaxID=979761 RepID=A0A9P6KGG2_9FUNG|nr:hypothetical protein BGW38_007941 [Lunasporangiospora selenospora]
MAELSNSRNQGRTLVLGLTTHASSVDPSILSCFEESVEMDVPTPLERQRILETSMAEYHSILQGKGAQRSKGSFEQETGNPSHHKLTVIENISMHCHGYLASDLDKLYRQALTRCGQQGKRLDEVSVEDFEDAMSSIQISSLRRNTGVQKTEQVSWNDIGGLEEVKRSLQESVIWIYQHADAYSRMGITPSKGVLLHGPPGTGKTLLAKAVATESKANFMAVSLPELIKGEVGESEKAISKIFQIAARCSPCIVFLDEVEAVFGNRESSGGLGKQLVSQILLEMDNCEKGVVFLAATNHPEAIDPSLLRAGRLDKLIHVPPPATEERMKILEILKRATRVSDSVDMKVIAEFTVGASGADLGALVRNAGHYALRAGRSEVTLQDFIDARLGSSRLHAF